MGIEKIDINQKQQWNDAVKKNINYDVFYLNEYLSAFNLNNNYEPALFVYKNGNDYATNAVFIRDISKDIKFKDSIKSGLYFDIITPYGYGGWIGTVSDKEKMEEEWNLYCTRQNYVSEFVRFGLFSSYNDFYSGVVESRSHNVIRSLSGNYDDIWMNYKHKVRKNVKRANEFNLKIIIENNNNHINDFLRIYYKTMDRTEADKSYYFSKDFFQQINLMKENIMYFYVVYQDENTMEEKIISTELVIYGADNCYSYLGGTDRDYFDMRPNDFLKDEIIKWGNRKGLKNFVLGGGYGKDDGIFEYKKNLAPDGIVNFYIGKKIINKEIYNMLVSIREKDGSFDKESSFFPLYRA